jgi:iron complex transport system substrate-binding protein
MRALSQSSRRLSAFICASFAFICVSTAVFPKSSAAAEISLTDDLGRTVEMKESAKRIVTLAPFLTELVFTAGAGNRVVGVSAYSDFPPEAKKLPQVSSALSWSLEEIAALKPDLVLAWRDNMRVEDVSRLGAFGIAVYVADARNFEDVPRALKSIGTLTGRDTSAAIEAYQQQLARLRAQYGAKPRVTALLEIWHSPLTTIAGRHFMNEALEICGARNVFSDLAGVAPVVSWEEVLLRDPDVIVGISSATGERDFRANWADRATLRAVMQGHLVYADADRLQRLTTRTPAGVASLCASIDRVRPAAPKQ